MLDLKVCVCVRVRVLNVYLRACVRVCCMCRRRGEHTQSGSVRRVKGGPRPGGMLGDEHVFVLRLAFPL